VYDVTWPHQLCNHLPEKEMHHGHDAEAMLQLSWLHKADYDNELYGK